VAYPEVGAPIDQQIAKATVEKAGGSMLARKLDDYFEDECGYIKDLPAGINYPDDDPYILELKSRDPDAVWDRYVPSEVIVARMKAFYEKLWTEDPETAKSFPEFDMPAGVWEYNPTWEFEWQEESEEVKQTFLKPRGPHEAAEQLSKPRGRRKSFR
jgi:hypothetical protein